MRFDEIKVIRMGTYSEDKAKARGINYYNRSIKWMFKQLKEQGFCNCSLDKLEDFIKFLELKNFKYTYKEVQVENPFYTFYKAF